jgi:glyoxylase-like metal-dependent hydrolase (beta-lactamase superfamily II)
VTWEHETEHVRVARISVGEWDNNVYVVACTQTNEAAIIDAAAEPDRILSLVDGLDVQMVITTHGHADHLGALDEVTTALSVPWRLHPSDVDIAGRSPDEVIRHGDEIHVGAIVLHALHTPGHTPGSVSLVIEPFAFSGDTLFPGGAGATRWDYSSFGQIMDSIEGRLMSLPDPTLVYPGHGAPTTIGAERPHLPEWRARGW